MRCDADHIAAMRRTLILDYPDCEGAQERNQSNSAIAMCIQGDFYFHPSDEDLSLGTPLREKPLEGFAPGTPTLVSL